MSARLPTFGGLSVVESRYPPGTRLPLHVHERACLSLMLRGGQRESIGSRSHECPSHSAVLKPAEVEHENIVGQEGAYGLFVEMSPAVAESLSDAMASRIEAECFADADTRRLVRRIGQEVELRPPGAELVVEGLLFELLGALVRKRARPVTRRADAWLSRAMEYLEANYRSRFSLADVAAGAGVHPSHLAEVFRSRHAMSVGEWVRVRRLEYAREALLDPRRSISEVALAAGFADQSHLTRLFRGRFGVTPSEFRRAMT